MNPQRFFAQRSKKAVLHGYTAVPWLLAALFTVAPIGGALAGPVDCEALKNSSAPFELTTRIVASYALPNGKGETRPASDYKTRVLRKEDGHLTTFFFAIGDKSAPIITDKHYFRTLKGRDGEGAFSEYIHETPLAYDPVSRKENFAEVYKRLSPGRAPLRQRVEAVFVEEGSVTLGGCQFKIYRYRSTLFNEPFDSGKPITVATIDYAPELMIQVRSESKSDSPAAKSSMTSSAIAISTDLSPLPEAPGDGAKQ